MTRTLSLAVVLICVWCSALAFAWGPEGHRAVAQMAQQKLSPNAKAAVAAMLGSQTLPDIATWADDVRNARPFTKRWHYTDVPINATSYKPNRDCQKQAEGDCSIAALQRLKAVLVDTKASAND